MTDRTPSEQAREEGRQRVQANIDRQRDEAEQARRIGKEVAKNLRASSNRVVQVVQALRDKDCPYLGNYKLGYDAALDDVLRELVVYAIPNRAHAIPGAATGANPLTHATPNHVLELEDDEEQRIVVGALEQYADTKRYTVAASTAHRKMLDRQGAIAKSLAQRLT